MDNGTTPHCVASVSEVQGCDIIQLGFVFFFFFFTKSNSTTDSSSCCKLFSFFTCWDENLMSLTRGTCAWSPAGLQWQTLTPFKMAPKRLSDKYTQASHNLQFILRRWTSIGVRGQLLRSLACTDRKRSILVGHAETTQVDFEGYGQIL